MTSYGVDSYHINCGPGDCAIHVLVSNPSTNPQAVKVILIDGGKSRATTRSNIPNTINILGERYKFALRFDAIVITHWDDDHFAGILSVIRAELKEKAKVKPLPPVGSMQVSFLKYDVGGKPATVWYCPYWSLPGIKANGPPKSLRLSNMIVEIYFAGRGWVPLCVLKSGDLRGVNFLNNKPLPATKTPESITSPAVLVAQNPPGDPDVGIYCVAVNKLCLGPVGAEEIIDAPGTTETNLRSVCAMVIWTGGRISHYFAGDAEYTVEEKVVRWSQVGQKREVTSMKMGHHGAVSSTPTDMLGKFQPKNLVISCGSDYGHPSRFPRALLTGVFYFIFPWACFCPPHKLNTAISIMIICRVGGSPLPIRMDPELRYRGIRSKARLLYLLPLLHSPGRQTGVGYS